MGGGGLLLNLGHAAQLVKPQTVSITGCNYGRAKYGNVGVLKLFSTNHLFSNGSAWMGNGVLS